MLAESALLLGDRSGEGSVSSQPDTCFRILDKVSSTEKVRCVDCERYLTICVLLIPCLLIRQEVEAKNEL